VESGWYDSLVPVYSAWIGANKLNSTIKIPVAQSLLKQVYPSSFRVQRSTARRYWAARVWMEHRGPGQLSVNPVVCGERPVRPTRLHGPTFHRPSIEEAGEEAAAAQMFNTFASFGLLSSVCDDRKVHPLCHQAAT
jgi:hypothetical protein